MAEFAAHTVKSFDEDIAQLRAVITRKAANSSTTEKR